MGARGSSSGRTPPARKKPPARKQPQPAAMRLDAMGDAQLASFIQQALAAALPAGYHDDITQRLILAAAWNDKPEVLSSDKVEAAAKKKGAIALYRTNNHNGRTTSAGQFSDMFRKDAAFSTGGGGGQRYGGGMYFSDSAYGSMAYGSTYRGMPNTIGAVLNKRAKVADMSDLMGAKGLGWIKSHPQAAKSLGLGLYRNRQAQRKSYDKGLFTAMAMAMGYNVVSNKVSSTETYYTVLNRGALTTSTKDYWNSGGMKQKGGMPYGS